MSRVIGGLLAAGLFLSACPPVRLSAQGTRLLRQPTVSSTQIAFAYGGDLWIVGHAGGEARRLTATPAVESAPQLSPDGKWLAFTSNRSGNADIYLMPSEGGEPKRLTWHPADDIAAGWSPDGSEILFSSDRETAPVGFARLWAIPRAGGVERLLPAPMAVRGAWSPDGKRLVYDRVDRWDVERRNYRGGQNTPITILDLASLEELRLPNERTTDTHPVWLGSTIYFLSDRDQAANVWAWDVTGGTLHQVTHFKDADAKYLSAGGGMLVLEQGGYLHLLDPASGSVRQLEITVSSDFPWAQPRWTDLAKSISEASLSPTAKRALFQARGEIFTVPVEKGDARNLTRSPGAADRTPVWSPDGRQVAWFSDQGQGYRLLIGDQDGLTTPRVLALGDAKFAHVAAWSPDASRIAFVDDRSRLRVLELKTGRLTTADIDGSFGSAEVFRPAWSPDSRWLAYAKFFPNQYRRIMVWSVADGRSHALTDALADARSPVWDRGGRYLYFLASTDLGLASAWANVSGIGHGSTRGAYVALLRASDSTPFAPESDDERGPPAPKDTAAAKSPAAPIVRIDFERLDRRILPLQVPVRDYSELAAGDSGVVFLSERIPNQPGVTLHRYQLSKRKAEPFLSGVTQSALSADGKKLLYQSGDDWGVVGTDKPAKPGDGRLKVSLSARIDPPAEWRQIFEEGWRIERDFFYDPHLHGADWDWVHRQYAPLVASVRHRADLTYLLDQLGGELSVGHSFTGGGDLPPTDTTRVGLLGADLAPNGEYWRIARIYTGESWNPELRAPLDAPGLRVAAGNYLLQVNGVDLRVPDQPWRLLDGTADRQTVLRVNDRADTAGSWTITVVPVGSESGLRTRAWVENNRRVVDSLSGGRLGYVWVPNTGNQGVVSFNRYFFAQQDKAGAVIDERFNGGGLLDDYMVDYMSRRPIGGITNDVPGGVPYRLPIAGILGPKVLLINELAGSGGDYFPWAFHELGVGPLIGTRTWGGLIASCVPYPLVDGGFITSPCSAVFGLHGDWIVEDEGVPPDIEVPLEAGPASRGRDAQLERGVAEALKLLDQRGAPAVTPPAFKRRVHRPAR